MHRTTCKLAAMASFIVTKITTTLMLHLLLIIVIIPFTYSLSFDFTGFTHDTPNITYESSAYPENNAIRLTNMNESKSVGRATYANPIHLWDKTSGNLTDFSTSFTFTYYPLYTNFSSLYAMAFFLAPYGSRIPADNVTIGSIGLTPEGMELNFTTTNNNNPFVAVEFDMSMDTWDPTDYDVGIDISSLKSVTTVTWLGTSPRTSVIISYDSGSRNLSVRFTSANGTEDNYEEFMQGLSYIVDLREYLPEFVTIGFSAATGTYSAEHAIRSWSFSSSLEINNATEKTMPEESMGPNMGSSGNKTGLLIGLAVGGGCFCLVLGLFVFLVLNKKKKKMMRKTDEEDDEMYDVDIGDEFEKGRGPKKFSYNDLASATNNFSQEDKLGEGGFGGVYKGLLEETNSYVAVKRISSGSKQGIKEYLSEVRIISRLRHRNLVQLLGWCHAKRELLLVYELMPNGSLDSHLFKGRSFLSWGLRLKIAQGLASALLYLHEEWEQCVLHRDIKSSNILLDSNFNAKLGDFGLARLVEHDKESQTTVLAGTMGYMAPECVITCKASKETDVFSFGVVALEICCGKRPIDLKAPLGEVKLVDRVWRLYGKGKLLEAADPQLGKDYNQEEIERLMIVGLWCAHPDSGLRPSIRQAVLALNFEAPLPDLPVKMPMPTYSNQLALDAGLSPYSTGNSKISGISSSSVNSEYVDSSKFTESSGASPLMYSK